MVGMVGDMVGDIVDEMVGDMVGDIVDEMVGERVLVRGG